MKNLLLALSISLSPLLLIAQTGPGGVGSSTDNVAWYDVDRQGLSNGASVEILTDFSGNGNNATQSNSSRQPTVTASDINGRDVITFDGANHYFEDLSISDFDNITSFNFFAVFQADAGTVMGHRYNGSGSHNSRKFMYQGGNFSAYAPRASGSTAVTTASNSNYNLHASFWNQSDNSLNGFLNNSNYGSKTNANGTAGTHQRMLIGRNPNNTSGLLDGSIAEMIFFTDEMNVTERHIISNYLAAKYAIAITDDKFAFDATHPNEVAGIGQESATDNHTDARGTSIVQINSADDLENGEYMIWGHDGAGTGNNSTEIPAAFVATNGQRLNQEWRVDISGGDNSLGTVTIVFHMNGINFGTDKDDYRVLIDSDNDGGDFTDATVDPTVPVVVGSTITFTGITLSDGDYFTIGNSNDIETCFSQTSNDWQSVVWSCGSVPDSSNNVIIADGTTVTITAGTTESANDLDVGEGVSGTLVLGDNSTVIVKGDLEIFSNASMTFGEGATLIMRGVNGNQTIANNSGSALTIYNLEIDNANGVSTGAGTYEITSGLTLTNGNLTNNGTVTFLSTATETAHINPIPNGSILDGPGVYDVQRFRSGRAANWGNIASSGVDTDLEDLDGEIYMSGIPGGDGYAAAQGGGGFNSVWYWDATIDDYVEPNSTADAFLLGRGYEIWLADNLNTWNPQAWTLRGDIFVDPITLNVNSAGGGWNLLGNPYLGFLDWDQITTDNAGIVDGDYWYLDADLNAYASVSAGGGAFVPPGQGFWINTSGMTTINLDPSSDLLSGENSPIFRKRPARKDELRVLLTNENAEFGSAAYLRENEFAYEGLDEFDLTPLRVPDARACHVAFEAGAQEVMVNYINTDQDRVELPFTVTSGMKGEFSLNFTGLDALENYTCAQLIDENGNAMDVIEDQPYALQIDQENTTISYTLILSKTSLDLCDMSVDETMQSNVVVTVKDHFILIDYDLDQVAMSEVQVFNALGNRVITDQQAVSHARQILNAKDLSTGVYFVNVEVNGQVSTHKIILQ